jgi:tetratricopeptide (TPR) repeat protein
LPRSSDQSQSNDEESEPAGARPGVPPPGVNPDRNPNSSSSRSAIIDLSPPAGDRSGNAEDEAAATGVGEMTPWDPLKCAKDVEVGDFYFKQGNLKAAESRYREALYWKPGDAEATIRMARVFDKTGRIAEAQQFYQSYLKILPNGPYAKEAKKALEKLQKES